MIDITGYVLTQKHLNKAADRNPEGLRRLAKYLKIENKELSELIKWHKDVITIPN